MDGYTMLLNGENEKTIAALTEQRNSLTHKRAQQLRE